MGISPVLWQFLVKWLNASALFPREASTIAPYMDALYFFLLGMTITGILLVLAIVVVFSVRYRRAKNPVATQIEGSTLLEATWTIIPLGIFLVTFVWGALLYFRIYTPPVNSMNIYIVGKQWMWKAEHPGGQHEINALHIPIGQPIQLTMISQDVFHSFSVPDFRIKREVIPGRYSTVWFQATTPGVYHLFCTQYCGTNHSQMIGEVTAMTPADYKKWTEESTSGMSLAQNGERLFASMGCKRTEPGGCLRLQAAADQWLRGAGERCLHPRRHPESFAARDGGIRTHHAYLSGADQRRRADRPCRVFEDLED
jgi:cytochrome c oxidase subunit 2